MNPASSNYSLFVKEFRLKGIDIGIMLNTEEGTE